MPVDPPDTNPLVAERLLQVIDEGRRTATYKLALLMALIDACATNSDAAGRAPSALHTREIARHVLRLYLPHARSYLAEPHAGAITLRQITNKRSACRWSATSSPTPPTAATPTAHPTGCSWARGPCSASWPTTPTWRAWT